LTTYIGEARLLQHKQFTAMTIRLKDSAIMDLLDNTSCCKLHYVYVHETIRSISYTNRSWIRTIHL